MAVVTSKTPVETIPDTVLQYERQMRKRRAADKAGAPVTKDEHLKVLYEDEHVVVTDKPSGVLCVPGVNKHPSLLTVVHQLYAPTLSPMDKMIVHRLDMDTSGVTVFGRTVKIVCKLHAMFRDRKVEKDYEALVCGHVPYDSGRIDLPLQRDHEHPPFMRVATPKSEQEAAQVVQDLQHHGWKKIMRRKAKVSTTEFTVMTREKVGEADLAVTRMKLKPITGRTHQLRVHCAAMGHPIVGDPTYGIYGEASANGGFDESIMDELAPHRAPLSLQKQINSLNIEKMCLHAKLMTLRHPETEEYITWEAPTPF